MNGKLILHIGSPKTGTTTIQDFLDFARGRLLETSIIFPSFGKKKGGGHDAFRRTLVKKQYFDDEIQSTIKEYSKLFSHLNGQSLLMTSELLWTVSPSRVLDVYPVLRKFEVFVLVFLREQAAMIESHYKQKIKGGLPVRSIESYFRENVAQYDYKNVLDKWAKVFGKGHVVPVVYEDAGENIVKKFLCQVLKISGLSDIDSSYRVEMILNDSKLKEASQRHANRSLDDSILHLIYLINQSNLDDDIKRKTRTAILKNSAKLSKDIGDMPPICSPEFKKKIKEYYKDSNLSLKLSYFYNSEEYINRSIFP